MNPRATTALLLFTVLVLGLLFYLRSHVATTRDAAELKRYAAVFDPEDITEIDIVRGNETVSLRRENTGWRLASPVADRASPEIVDRLLMAIRFLEVRDRREADDPATLTECGLGAPRLRLDLRGAENIRLDLGADTPLPDEIFARLGGQKAVLRIPGTIAELARAPVQSFRDPRLTDLVADDIEKFTVRRDDGEMTVRRERGRWVIEKPVRADADPRAVREFLEPLLGLRITDFGAGTNATSTAGLLPGETAAVSITPRGGGEALEVEVARADTAEAGSVAARVPSRGGELQLDAEALRLFEVSPEAMRDRSLGFVDADTVDRILLEADGRALTLQRESDGWVSRDDGRKIGGVAVEALIAKFNATRVTSFRTAAAPAETGVDNPAGRVAFYSWLSENSAEEAAGAHVIAGADLGAQAPDGGTYARAAGTDETVTIPADLGAELRRLVHPEQPAANPR